LILEQWNQKDRNLYFAGEVLNIDGDTGGYNLQAAFSTGYVAGKTQQGTTNNEED